MLPKVNTNTMPKSKYAAGTKKFHNDMYSKHESEAYKHADKRDGHLSKAEDAWNVAAKGGSTKNYRKHTQAAAEHQDARNFHRKEMQKHQAAGNKVK